jgi:hypothetical protein
MGIAIMALVVNLSLVESDLRRYYPWFLPAEITNGILRHLLDGATLGVPTRVVPSLVTSVLGGTLVCVLAVWTLRRRDVF